MTEYLDVQHREMLDLARAILQVVEEFPARSSDKLNRARLALSRTVTAHCKAEAALLEQCSEQIKPEIMRRYHDELLAWRYGLIACNTDWPPERVWDEPAGFKAAFRKIVDALQARILWERSAIYPIILHKAA